MYNNIYNIHHTSNAQNHNISLTDLPHQTQPEQDSNISTTPDTDTLRPNLTAKRYTNTDHTPQPSTPIKPAGSVCHPRNSLKNISMSS